MDEDDRSLLSRRKLLQAGLASSTITLSGCQEGEPTDRDESTDRSDQADPPTQESGSEPPTISTVKAKPTENRGELEVHVEAEHTRELSELSVSTSTAEFSESTDNTRTLSARELIDSSPGEFSLVSIQVTDSDGNTAEETIEAYARADDVLSETELDFSSIYEFSPKTCVSSEPGIGGYDELSEDVVYPHVDALQGSGVSRVTIAVNGQDQIDAASAFDETDFESEFTIQFRYNFRRWLNHGVSLDSQLQTLKDGIQKLGSYDRIDGRPVVVLPALESINFQQTPVWDEVLSEFDGVSALVDHIREALTIDGAEPFLVGETAMVRTGWASPKFHDPQQLQALLEQLDALQNGPTAPDIIRRTELSDVSEPSESRILEAWLQFVSKQLRVLHRFATDEGLEFIPRIQPGIVEGQGGCPPDDTFSRDPDRFGALLRYAAGHATSDRVTIDSFNDWGRGTQIEPGRMMGTDYGDSYLETVRSAATNGAVFARGGRDTYHVAEDGRDWNTGAEAAPFETIQEGLLRAGPGATIEVHSGSYQERIWTAYDGEPDAPITITGPEDAVLQPPESGPALWIKNSHIHLTGLTIDGLLNPEAPDDVSSYSKGLLIGSRPPDDSDAYLEDIVCAPAGIGNSVRSLMVFQRTKNLEIGPLRIVGLAGAEYVIGDKQSHVGEFVYLGQPPRVIEGREHEKYNWGLYPWKGELDQTRNVHVHHIDNSEGHAHSQLVNTKTGTRDVLVEYCTDAGGSYNTEPWNKCADIRFQSHDATLRWCDLRDGEEHAIQIGDPYRDWLREHEDMALSASRSGTNHSIYGNRIQGFGEKALQIDTTAEEQRVLCRNDISDPADGDIDKQCPRDLPEGDGIGHLGGDSPWTDG